LRISGSSRIVPRRLAAALGVLIALLAVARPDSQGSSYVVYTADGQRNLPYRTAGNVDFVPLQQVASIFGLSLAEDTLVGGLTVRGRGQTILLIPGQSFASIGPGRIVSLPAPIERSGNNWQVPVDFLRLAVGPALGTRVEVRRPTHVILVGDVRLPRVTTHFERQGPAGRLIINIQPAAPYQVTRQGNRLTVRFDAVALDASPASDLAAEFVTGVRVDGTSLLIDLGPESATHRAEDRSPTQLHIDLLPPGPPPPPPPPPPAPTRPAAPDPGPLPVVEVGAPGVLRTIAIDPGHGGEDAGVTGRGGTVEKDYVLAFARQLKSTIENRIGLRVILTRDRDDDVPLDRRAALANNNKADLFISLHANASVRPTVSGAQVLSLRLDDYGGNEAVAESTGMPVTVLGGGSRVIEVLPWDRAQIGFTRESRAVADILRQQLTSAGIAQLSAPAAELPLRPLVGVSMPAILVDLGMLSNTDDERALNSADHRAKFIDAILATIGRIRQGIPMPAEAR
jgi:N-acetylmuramoyl-L-alanine amidase